MYMSIIKPPSLIATTAAVAFCCATANAYVANTTKWPNGVIKVEIKVPAPTFPLEDGTASYAQAIQEAIATWNNLMGRVQIEGVILPNSGVVTIGDGVNTITFGDTNYGSPRGETWVMYILTSTETWAQTVNPG